MLKASKLKISLLILISLLAINFAFPQTQNNDAELKQAMEFIESNKHINALPLLEKLVVRYPQDGELQAHLGVAILVNSVTLKEEENRKKEVARAGVILKKSRQLGTKNKLALHYLDLIEQGLEVGVGFGASSKEVEDALREGEGFFGRGEFDKAFKAYERAYKLDPKNFDAVLFMGDTFYAQKKFAESEKWFAKAVEIDPNREQAWRFWADALANQNKTKEALVKYAEAFIAQPNSRLTFDALVQATQNFGERRSSPFILIPAKEGEQEVEIDLSLVENEQEKSFWNAFTETRKAQIKKFNTVANGRTFSSTVSEDVEALNNVAKAAKTALEKNKSLKLSKSMENLIKLDSLGMLDIYAIFFLHGSNENPEYTKFREKNRGKMRKFLVDYFADDKL